MLVDYLGEQTVGPTDAMWVSSLVGSMVVKRACCLAERTAVLMVARLVEWTADQMADSRVGEMVCHWAEPLVNSLVDSTAAKRACCLVERTAGLTVARLVEWTADQMADSRVGEMVCHWAVPLVN